MQKFTKSQEIGKLSFADFAVHAKWWIVKSRSRTIHVSFDHIPSLPLVMTIRKAKWNHQWHFGDSWWRLECPSFLKVGVNPLPMNLSHKKKEEEENPWHQQHLFSRRRASLNLSNVYVSCYTHMQMELYCFGRSTSNSSSGSSYIGLVIVLCSTSTTTRLIVVTSESENWLHCRIWGVIFVHSLFGWCTDESSHLANELIYEMENCTLFYVLLCTVVRTL